MESISILETLAALPRRQVDSLLPAIGPVGSYHRLIQLESDRRWKTKYLALHQGLNIVGFVPIYSSAIDYWPDEHYNPREWGFSGSITPRDCLLIGARHGLSSAIRAKSNHDIETLIKNLRQMDLYEHTTYVFPFFDENQTLLLQQLFGERAQTYLIGKNSSLDHHLERNPPTLNDRVRRTLRLDAIDEIKFGATIEETSWPLVKSWAADLIAKHASSKGSPDHSILVNRRMETWTKCSDVEMLPLVVRISGIVGIVITLITNDWMDVHEIGMPEGRSEVRRSLYAMLMYHAPMRLAKSRNVTHLRLGLGTEIAKHARGAESHNVYGIVVQPEPR